VRRGDVRGVQDRRDLGAQQEGERRVYSGGEVHVPGDIAFDLMVSQGLITRR